MLERNMNRLRKPLREAAREFIRVSREEGLSVALLDIPTGTGQTIHFCLSKNEFSFEEESTEPQDVVGDE